jgi:hypothetical protein
MTFNSDEQLWTKTAKVFLAAVKLILLIIGLSALLATSKQKNVNHWPA